MLWYQNVATLITQFIIPLIVLCVLNLQVIMISLIIFKSEVQVARTIINAAEQRKELVAKERREHSTAKMMIFVVIGELRNSLLILFVRQNDRITHYESENGIPRFETYKHVLSWYEGTIEIKHS